MISQYDFWVLGRVSMESTLLSWSHPELQLRVLLSLLKLILEILLLSKLYVQEATLQNLKRSCSKTALIF